MAGNQRFSRGHSAAGGPGRYQVVAAVAFEQQDRATMLGITGPATM